MKSKLSRKKRIALIGLSIAIMVAWVWRYISINQFYDEHTTKTIAYYTIEDEVPFGTDYLALHESADGYYIQVESFEIVDFVTCCEDYEVSLDSRQVAIPDKLVLVHITLRNEYSNDQGINLSNFSLYGIDSNPPLDYDLLRQINSILSDGSWGISLPHNSEYQVTLPYMLFREYYKTSTWNNIHDYTFYLQVTAFPTVKCIQLES